MTSSLNPESLLLGNSFSVGGIIRRFIRDLFNMHGWQKIVLIVAGFSAGSGFAHEAYHFLTDSPAVQNPGAPGALPPGPISQQLQQIQPIPSTQPSGPNPVSRWFSRAGGSILLGFVIGWAFRTFVKFMTMLSALVVAGLGFLSYFHILNADLTAAANQDYKTASAWITDQADKLRGAGMNHVRSTSGGIVGLAVGLKKRRTEI